MRAGTGWGAVSLLKTIDTTAFDITLVSPRPYFLFTPLLPQVTTGAVYERSLMEPIRALLAANLAGSTYLQAAATYIDPSDQTVTCCRSEPLGSKEFQPGAANTPFRIPYDYLVVAVGATANTFNTPGVQDNVNQLAQLALG